jgi:hypothetical protein
VQGGARPLRRAGVTDISIPTMGVLAAFFNLCRLRAGPQDLPYSPGLLLAVIIAEFGFSVMANNLLATAEVPPSPWRMLWAIVLTQGALYGVLRAAQKGNRFMQTALAWNAIVLVFDLLTVPMLALMGHLPAKPEEATALQLALSWPMLAVIVWVCVALVRVMRQALELRTAAALLLTLAVLLFAPLLAPM